MSLSANSALTGALMFLLDCYVLMDYYRLPSSCSDHCATIGLFIYITLTGDAKILK